MCRLFYKKGFDDVKSLDFVLKESQWYVHPFYFLDNLVKVCLAMFVACSVPYLTTIGTVSLILIGASLGDVILGSALCASFAGTVSVVGSDEVTFPATPGSNIDPRY